MKPSKIVDALHRQRIKKAKVTKVDGKIVSIQLTFRKGRHVMISGGPAHTIEVNEWSD